MESAAGFVLRGMFESCQLPSGHLEFLRRVGEKVVFGAGRGVLFKRLGGEFQNFI